MVADMAFYDRIEVLRGASGLVTGMGDDQHGAQEAYRRIPGLGRSGSGFMGDKRGVIDLSGPLNEAGSVRGRLVAAGQDADSHIDNHGRSKAQIYGVVEADLSGRTRATAGLEHGRTKVRGQGSYIGFPLWFKDGSRTDLPVSFTGASRDNRLELEPTKAFATLEQQLGAGWKLKLSASHARSSHREERTVLNSDSAFYDIAGNGVSLWASKRGGDIENSIVDVNLSGPFSLLGREHELVLGAAHEEYDQLMQARPDTSGLNGTPANLFTWDRTGAGVYGPVNVNSHYVMRQSSLYGAVLEPTEGANHEVGLKSAWLDGRLNTALALYQIRQDNVAEADAGYFVPGTMDTGASRSVKGTRTQGLDLEVFGALARDSRCGAWRRRPAGGWQRRGSPGAAVPALAPLPANCAMWRCERWGWTQAGNSFWICSSVTGFWK